MRTDMGLFDRLFGKKTTLQLPRQDGSIHEIKVTLRWLEEMERLGKISPVGGQTIKVHILDPQAGLGQALGLSDDALDRLGITRAPDVYRVEEWTIGEHISADEYKRFADPRTRELYVLLVYKAGKSSTRACPKEIWLQARKAMGA